MSWDVIILNISGETRTVSELTDDSVIPLGSRDEVLSIIHNVFPQVNLSDPTWIILDGNDYSIEINVSQNHQIDTLMLHVRGNPEAINAIESLCKATGWRAFDPSGGDFIDFTNPDRDKGFQRWQGYNDFIVNKYKDG
jgi:hypothetical protein